MTKQNTNNTVNSKENAPAAITTVKTSKCPSLSGKSTLTYQLGCNQEQEIFFRILANDGGGHFNKDWMTLEDALNQFNACPEKVTSHMLTPLLMRKSSNSAGFFLATMLAEEIIKPSKEKQRCYTLQETKPFIETVTALCKEKVSGNSKSTPRRKQQPSKTKASTKQT